jgi:hypothetical protein
MSKATGPQLWVLNKLGWLRVDTDALAAADVAPPVFDNGAAVSFESACELIALAVSRGFHTPKNPTRE